MNISKLAKLFFNNAKKVGKNKFFRAKFYYTNLSNKIEIDDKLVFFEAFSGDDFSGNPFYVFESFCRDDRYKDFKKVIGVTKSGREKVRELIKKYGYVDNVELAEKHGVLYCRCLASAKYLVTNVAFPSYFIKREGQVYLNTWHGTPLKGLGRNIKDNPNSIGNVQRNFLMSDYLLYPNDYSFEHIRNDYMLDNMYKGKYVLAGYPCNSRFFENPRAKKIREEFELTGKKVVVYMPTWRSLPKNGGVNKQIYYIMHLLVELESRLDKDTVVFVKLHHLAQGEIDLTGFEKIREFPYDYETYDFLSIADCLITDYSSVMFDFANSGKKILLYTYDKEEYMAGRSMYFDIEKLPFFASYDARKIADAVNDDDKERDYSDFVKEFCPYDNKNAAGNLVRLLVTGNAVSEVKTVEGSDYHNGKENVLLYTGVLAKNGMTTAMKNLVCSLDAEKRNYILTFYARKTNPNKLTINEFPENVAYLPMQGAKSITPLEAVMQVLYYLNIDTAYIGRVMDRIYKRELKRCFPTLHFDYAIHFTGYEKHIMQLMGRMDCKKYIWAHNNMYMEAKTKGNFHVNSIKYAYENFDKIVIVRDTMKDELKTFMSEKEMNKIVVVHNQNDVKNVLEKAALPVEFQDDTFCNVELRQLCEILGNKSVNKFINIARFSKEKGIDRLITAFDKYRRQRDNSAWLIIIGGYGSEFDNILSMVQDEEGNTLIKNVVVIKSIVNPYSILSKCDAFVLSSLYEGLPMTIIEALMLNVPVISTDITGPREFLQEGYGYLVEDSEQGLVKGFWDFKDGKLGDLKKFDVEKFNSDAMEEFESIFN